MKFSLTIFVLVLSCVAVSEYVEVLPQVYLQDQVIEESLNFGANYILTQATNKNVVPKGSYGIANLTKVEQQLLKNGVDYKFHVYIASTHEVNVTGRFTVNYKYETKAFKVTSHHYTYRFPSKLKGIEGLEYIWNHYDFIISSSEEEEEIGIPEEETSEEENENPPTKGYVDLTPEQYLSNQIIENGLNFGGNYIINQAIGRNVLPKGDYRVENLTKVEQQLLKNGVDYRYHVYIASAHGVNVTGRFTVYYRYSTKTFKVVSQHYNYRYPSKLKELEGLEYIWNDFDFGIPSEEEEETPEEHQEETSNSEEENTLPGEEEDPIPGETEFPTEEFEFPSEEFEYPGYEWEFPEEETQSHEEEYEVPEEENQVPEDTENIEEENGVPEEEEEENSPSKGYVELSPEKYLGKQAIEDGLNFGGNYIINQAIERKVLPKGDYKVTSLAKVEQQLLKNGADYRYHAHITSSQGVKVNGRFTVYYRYSNKTFKVVSQNYSYRYPSKLKNLDLEYSWENYSFAN